MGRVCSTNGGRRGMHIGYLWASQKLRDRWEYLEIGGQTILKWILRNRMDWIDLAQDSDQWRTLVNTVMLGIS
jgi:hypothetical protein